MKKRRVHRPRRGLRISNGVRSAGNPAGGFIGGPPILRTRSGPASVIQRQPTGAYPDHPTEMQQAAISGTWNYGWLFDEPTGTLASSFPLVIDLPDIPLQFDTGSGGSAIYGRPGWLGQPDLSIGFPSGSDTTRFDGGPNFNVVSGSDLLIAYVGRWRSVPEFTGPGTLQSLFGKFTTSSAGDPTGWGLFGNAGTSYALEGWAGPTFYNSTVGATYMSGVWHVGIGALDRSSGRLQFGIRSLESFTGTIGTVENVPAAASFTASANFYLGALRPSFIAGYAFELAALYMSTGSQVATGVLPNLDRALVSFASYVGGVISQSFHSSLPAFRGDRDDTVHVSGAVFRSVGAPPNDVYRPFSLRSVFSTSSLFLQGSVSMGRMYERRKLNATLISAPVNFQGGLLPGTPAWPSVNVIDVYDGVPGLPSGTQIAAPFGGLQAHKAPPPSWTRIYMGESQAFVIPTLSSSHVENRFYNTFTSGTEPLEHTAVPSSGTLYFSKEQRLRTVTVKKTASFFDTVVRSGSWVPQSFSAASGCLFSLVTGVLENSLVSGEGTSKQSSTWAPASILIPVPVSGRIVDVKVWLELIQGSSSDDPFPLGNLGVALRSPNLTWGNAHPIRNDPGLVRVYTSPGDTFSWLAGIHEGFRRMYAGSGSNVNRFYRDTFLLWEGPAIFDASSACNMPTLSALDGGQFGRNFAVWQKDRGMRTVFSDGSSVYNPRHLFGSPSGNFVGSPNAGLGRNRAFGADVPWTSEAGIRGSQQFASAGSPPAGWLTGPGGTNAVNEWPTTGVNYGTNSIKPIYPFLDSLSCRKRITNEASAASGTTNSTIPESYRPDLWTGFRPGLRGTEVSGTWELLLVAGGSFIDDPVPNWYFRQVRLEFILESPSYVRPSRFTSRRQPFKGGAAKIIQTISGSDAVLFPPLLSAAVAGWDYWLTDVFAATDQAGEVGRSFGLRLKTGSIPSDTALVYRLTGALGDIVGNTPSWLLEGPGGMPAIPESSATLVPFVPEPIASAPPASFLEPRRLLDLPQRLQDVANDQNPVLSLRQLADRFASSSST